MAKSTKKQKRPRAGLLTKLVILVLVVALGWKLQDLHRQVQAAQAEKENYIMQVNEQQQINDTLKADIAEGVTQEKIEEIAREELGLVTPGEYVFYDTSN